MSKKRRKPPKRRRKPSENGTSPINERADTLKPPFLYTLLIVTIPDCFTDLQHFHRAIDRMEQDGFFKKYQHRISYTLHPCCNDPECHQAIFVMKTEPSDMDSQKCYFRKHSELGTDTPITPDKRIAALIIENGKGWEKPPSCPQAKKVRIMPAAQVIDFYEGIVKLLLILQESEQHKEQVIFEGNPESALAFPSLWENPIKIETHRNTSQ